MSDKRNTHQEEPHSMTGRPEKGTAEYELWVAAIEVAIYPPLTNARGQADAMVSWRRLKELRAALDALGIDWREAKKKDDALRAERQRKQKAPKPKETSP